CRRPRRLAWQTFDQACTDYSIEQLDEVDTLIFGRVTYEGMVAYWPTQAGEDFDAAIAARMNAISKTVVSRTQYRAEWALPVTGQGATLPVGWRARRSAPAVERVADRERVKLGRSTNNRVSDPVAGERQSLSVIRSWGRRRPDRRMERSGPAPGDDAVLLAEEGADSRVEEVVAQDDRYHAQIGIDAEGG